MLCFIIQLYHQGPDIFQDEITPDSSSKIWEDQSVYLLQICILLEKVSELVVVVVVVVVVGAQRENQYCSGFSFCFCLSRACQ